MSARSRAGGLAPHPLLKILPQPTAEALTAMIERVKAHGQVGPIQTVDGRVVVGWLECQSLLRLGNTPKVTKVKPEGSLVDYVLTNNIPPHRPGSLAVACALVLARPRFKQEMREKMSQAARAGRAGNIAHPLGDADERWWKRAAVRWGCTPYHVRLMARIHDQKPEVFEAVRTNLLVDAKEVSAVNNNPELGSAEDRRNLLKRYAQGRRRGKNVILDLAFDVARERSLAKLPAGLRAGRQFVTYEGDMEEQAVHVADGSVHLMVADIIYGDIQMAAKVARLALRKLASGGVLAVYNGHERTMDVLRALAEHLELRATAWHRMPSSIRGAGSIARRVEGLPVWLFCRSGERRAHVAAHLEFTSGDAKTPNGTALKKFHRWEKALDATVDLVRSLAPRGSLVLDPCCGSGTTGEAALHHGCRFVGIDIDRSAVEIARARLTQVERELLAKRTPKKGGGA